MPSKLKFLALYVPGGLILGVGALAMQIAAHGFDSGVIAGLVAGAGLCLVALALIRAGLRRPLDGETLRAARRAQAQTRRATVSAGFAIAIVATAAGLFTGAVKPVVFSAFGLLFAVLTPVAAYAVLRGRGLYSAPPEPSAERAPDGKPD